MSPNKPNAAITDSAGTAGGKRARSINGQTRRCRSIKFRHVPPGDGQLRENNRLPCTISAWYQLPPRGDRPLVVVSAAGLSGPYKEDGDFIYGQSLKLRWASPARTAASSHRGGISDRHRNQQPAWRNLAVSAGLGAAGGRRGAQLSPRRTRNLNWSNVRFYPPRVPVLESL